VVHPLRKTKKERTKAERASLALHLVDLFSIGLGMDAQPHKPNAWPIVIIFYGFLNGFFNYN